MRALTISTTGSLDAVEYRTDIAEPSITGPGQVRLRLRAASLNHLNLWTIRGLPGAGITPNWVLGSDGTGIVEEVSADVTSVAPGDRVVINPGLSCRQCDYCRAGEHPLCVKFRVMGEQVPGTFAELVVLPAANVRAIPAGVSDGDAGAFGLAAITAWRMLVSRAKVQAGDEVLIWGIGGGVAQAALRIAKTLGARVWVTSGSDDKLQRAKALGADELINHTGIDVGKEVRARTGKRGVNVVIDSVGSVTWEQSLGALGRAGRLVTCGGTSGHVLQMDVRKLFWNQWTVMGSTMGNDAEFEAVVAELVAGRLSVPVDSVYPLERGRDALAHLQSGAQFGKVVLQISP
ncbi:MAG: zinc-binding dehydrogenase [Gemmatimonadetes bacterium]|jgi:NADPH:quinone reductase-like Zn-dependent oxidoreductase|nr:zinc-binding dehydrogenase [Gemmatimonadota bacterium]